MIEVFDFASAPTTFMPRPPSRHIAPSICERERALLTAIRRYASDWSYGPSVRDLCTETGITSSGIVANWLRSLRRKGYVTWSEGKNRTLRLTGLEQPPVHS